MFFESSSECVVYLDASDDLLRDRVMNLPEKVVQEQNYEQDHFLGRLAKYRENDAENDTVLQYFDEIDIAPLYIGNPCVTVRCVYMLNHSAKKPHIKTHFFCQR